MDKYQIFINAINKKFIVKVKVNSNEKGIIERQCVPFDYGLSGRYKDGLERYHFYDLDSPEGKHNLSILPMQLIEITLLDKTFEPGDYVKWEPKWIVKRDWGAYS
ncbi:hypothetical protein LGL55_10530 [Clostridium tagluense]|uniref:hypothetical protein n=1 Tax=Clostridium tagluense TaxID=360422 RepID=UPI001CF2FCA9|nr:hypothetical protein [Clostridium tagluense]MCB2311625.1 hypothetical protein [Clostridium tagluense]MCB2316349.1 hypothetical protein [Clostridium tagluense]MCB2321267.1 hypothetical protein [Clostridium tagluense]MCB2326218.1 hypothetical protein [Clostridium tagluense]MCB2331003.1 hypothetical protein [Clostridium tagluense]